MVTQAPNEGYGWEECRGVGRCTTPGGAPSTDSIRDKAVMASDGSRGWALPSSLLTQIFGSNWRQVVYS